jgi:hypothetical protein
MAFQVSLVKASTQEVAVDKSEDTLIISDYSDYISNAEDGHSYTHFDAYYKIIITKQDNTIFTFSSLGTDDEDILPPSSYTSSPIPTTYTFNEDGVYSIKIVAVPSWQSLTTPAKWDINDCVYQSGKLYKAIAESTNEVVTDTAHWVEITEDELSSKYYTLEYVTVACSLDQCYIQALLDANCGSASMTCVDSTFCDNKYFLKAVRLFLIKQSLQTYMDLQDWDRTKEVLNTANNICCECN